MTNWSDVCKRYEDDIIEYATNIAYLQMDARYFDNEEDAFVLLDLDSANDMIGAYEMKIRTAAKALVSARTRVATQKNSRTINYSNGMPFTPA